VIRAVGEEVEARMELTGGEADLFAEYLGSFASLTGDRRTRTLLGETVRGIIGAESLCCSRIAAFSPCAGGDAARRAAGAADGPR
jgi:hypothetical protein